jgi:hypothetical protein
MKKMIPVYILQVLMLAALIFMSIELLTVKRELVQMRTEQASPSAPFGGRALRVEVVNTPTVEIDNAVEIDSSTPVHVKVDEPLSVNVDNEPDVRIAP